MKNISAEHTPGMFPAMNETNTLEMTNLFDQDCKEANRFIENLALQLGRPGDIKYALRVLKGVFHALRQRVTVFESTHLISQLPLILKAIYVDGWHTDQPLPDIKTIDDFLALIRNSPTSRLFDDFDNDDDAKEKIRIVFIALRQYVDETALDEIREELPDEIAEMV